jgi:DNA primase
MRIDPDQIWRAKEVDLPALISRQVKLIRRGRVMVGLCPFHQEKTPSFKVENGRFHCFGCGADGDAISWIQITAGMTFRNSVEELTGDRLPKAAPRQDDERCNVHATAARVREARAIWSSAKPIAGTKAEYYLRARGICGLNPSLRFAEQFPYTPAVRLPAMIAAMLSPMRELVAIQVTMLNPQKPEKAAIATPRRTIGAMGAGAVRLAAASHFLGLAEGVETALSAMQLTGVPAWACLGAGRMQRVHIPASVGEIHLFGDNDSPGRDAVERTSQVHAGKTVTVSFPPAPAGDWNDYLRTVRSAGGAN